uniref:Uncharacterized protein n=1 Tax=Kalanchoe fedtschenkoi TaxID=63787 RepID=A0A7N1A1U8_KALFE
MDDDALSPNTILPATSIDSDFINELLLDGCWVETTDGDEYNSLLSPPMTSAPLANSLSNLPDFEAPSSGANSIPDKDAREEPTETSKAPRKRPLRYSQVEDPAGAKTQDWGAIQKSTSSGKSESYLVDISEPNKRIWIGPKTNVGTSPSVRDRLMSAIRYLSESTRDRNILIQIWLPVKSGNKHVLTTNHQPYTIDPNSLSLAQYRNVSENYQFPAEENSRQSAGLPGRVFLRKVPEWTPDVRCFRQEEYPRIAFAQQLNVQGSLALPVFEQGSGSCLGVVEIVTTCQKINYRPELETVCRALEAFQLRSSEITGIQNSKILNDSYIAASPQISEFLTYTCKAHNLPLAQTWAPCIQHSNSVGENTTQCMSTVDAAYYVGDQKFIGFHEECCEQHLLGDQGIVGKAFTTKQLCFAPDITTYSKTDYPLSHHAILFGLCAAVAVRVRSIFTGTADFVLEFFLPVSCKSFEDQQRMIGSLWDILQGCQSLYVVTENDLQEESSALLEIAHGNFNENATSKSDANPLKKASQEDSSWIANMMGAQNKGKGVSILLDASKEEPHEEFKMTTSWDNTEDESQPVFEDFDLQQQGPKKAEDGGGVSPTFGGNRPSGSRKSGEKKQTKTEKTIGLPVLQQYFSGSLKDAARSLGVCPTTLKRICRQHGINRWPSRKIKKVGHSLKKLQLVMDSVQGPDGSIQISSFYSKFPELGSPNVSGTSSHSVAKQSDRHNQLNRQHEEASLNPLSIRRKSDDSVHVNPQIETGLLSPLGTTSKSPSSSCSQKSTSSLCYSTGAKQDPLMSNTLGSTDALFGESSENAIKQSCSDAELLQLSIQHETRLLGRSQSHKSLPEQPPLEMLPPLPKSTGRVLRDNGAFRLKVTFGEVKVRFSLQRTWVFADLQQEIAKRFNIDDMGKLHLKYLDDDSEWVLLTCDADLEECLDLHKAAQSQTVKLCVLHAPHTNLGTSFGSSGLS